MIETRRWIIDRFAVGSGSRMADTAIHVEIGGGGPYFNRPGNTGVACRPLVPIANSAHAHTPMYARVRLHIC